MKASVLVGPGQHRVMDVPKPSIADDEVLIKVHVCGVCASEYHTWMNGPSGHQPVIMGHEPMGVIEEIGSNVHGFQIGDRVTGLFYHAFAEYSAANYTNLVHLPDDIDDINGIGEPLSCLVSGANRTPVTLGDTVAIVGLGFMGLGFLQLMKLKGAGTIVAIDVRQESLDNAKRFGADVVLFPDEVPAHWKVLEWGQIGQGVDVSVEASGSQAALDLATQMAKAHGTVSVVGYHQSNQGTRSVQMDFWNWKALTIINAHERRNHVHVEAMKSVLSLIQAGKFNMAEMITNVFSLDEVDKGYEAIKQKPPGFIKSVIRIG